MLFSHASNPFRKHLWNTHVTYLEEHFQDKFEDGLK